MTPDSAALGILILVILVLTAGAGIVLRRLSRLHLRRSVLVHVEPTHAWRIVSDLPRLLSAHGRARDRAALDEWRRVEGNGEEAGSVWLGRSRDGDCWVELQVVRRAPSAELTFRLLRDSRGTQELLRHHRASLTLSETRRGHTKITWELVARLRGLRLPMLRIVSPSALYGRLMDIGLRSIKSDIAAVGDEVHDGAHAPAGAAAPVPAGTSPTMPPSPPIDPSRSARPPKATL